MKKAILILCSFVLFVVVNGTLSSCNENPVIPDVPEKETKLDFNMYPFFGDLIMELAGKYYVTAHGDSIQPVTLIYHINNFALHQGTDSHEINDSWFMMDFANAESTQISFKDVAEGSYDAISFTIGVEDSITNSDGLLNNKFTVPMYWSMNAGYINFKFEGNSPQAPNKTTVLHLGGYTGNYKLARRVKINLPAPLTLRKGEESAVNIKMDMAKYFSSPNIIDLSMYHLIHEPNDQAKDLSDNIPSMFSLLP